MIYPYHCKDCNSEFEVIKSVRMIDDPEKCEACGSLNTEREIAQNQSFYGAGDWNTQTFNQSLGCYVRSQNHARKIAKEKGFEEIGNEDCGKIERHFERNREEKAEQRYNDCMREKVYED